MSGKTAGVAFLLVTALGLVCTASARSIASRKSLAANTTSITSLESERAPTHQTSADTHSKQESKSTEPEFQKLQGNWQVIRWEDESGEQVPADELKYFTFYFEGDRLTMRKFKDDAGTPCQFRIDTSKQPRWIDLGMPNLSAGSTVLEGIYTFEGEELKVCITSGLLNGVAPPRPTEFKTGRDQKYAVLSLKRIP